MCVLSKKKIKQDLFNKKKHNFLKGVNGICRCRMMSVGRYDEAMHNLLRKNCTEGIGMRFLRGCLR